MKLKVGYLIILLFVALFAQPALAQNNEAGVRVIVIDAGHGGSAFPGAVYGGVKEKDINLAVALKLGALIEKELPTVKVVYTRTSDKALGKSLNEDLSARADIANKAGGDFFISIHANAAPKATSVQGAETIIMGESVKETKYNEDVLYDNNKEELIDMSDENTAAMVRAYIQNLQFTYGEYSEMMARIMQSHYQKGGRKVRNMKRQLLKVLYATDMPSVLTELGFMSNKSELAYMNSEKGQNAYARMLCDAVKEYVGHIDRLAGVETPMLSPSPEVVEEPAKTVVETVPTSVQKDEAREQKAQGGYTIQLLASDKAVKATDSQFKSYRSKVVCYMGGGVLKYKYCYGSYPTRQAAQQDLVAVKRTFKDAFIVRYEGENIVK
ncbi:MAG: N-acetylmuramoyl-L-alanine amidase [Alistipes sp.]|nr:N-acetylmuramoyl-L-alanine amidase [Alistipes sp.]MBO5984693.1 N-acetylmuramoyl-L-alanine amidase [Rikenellaceae bacterium]